MNVGKYGLEFTTEVYIVCGVLIFKNGHEVYSHVGDMSRTFNHLFDVINMPTQKFLIYVHEQRKISW